MTTKNHPTIPTSAHADYDPLHSNPDKSKPLTDEERERIRKYYRSLNFKEFLAACPIDGIDLTREPAFPREVEL